MSDLSNIIGCVCQCFPRFYAVYSLVFALFGIFPLLPQGDYALTQSSSVGVNFAALPFPCDITGNDGVPCITNDPSAQYSDIYLALEGFIQLDLVGAPAVHVTQNDTLYTGTVTYSHFLDITKSGIPFPGFITSTESLTNNDYGTTGAHMLLGTGCSFAPGQEATCATFDSKFGASVSAGLLNVTDPTEPPSEFPLPPYMFIIVGEPGNTTLANGTAGGSAYSYFAPVSQEMYRKWAGSSSTGSSSSSSTDSFLPNNMNSTKFQFSASSIWGAENGGQGEFFEFELGASIATTYNTQMTAIMDPRVATTPDSAYIGAIGGLLQSFLSVGRTVSANHVGVAIGAPGGAGRVLLLNIHAGSDDFSSSDAVTLYSSEMSADARLGSSVMLVPNGNLNLTDDTWITRGGASGQYDPTALNMSGLNHVMSNAGQSPRMVIATAPYATYKGHTGAGMVCWWVIADFAALPGWGTMQDATGCIGASAPSVNGMFGASLSPTFAAFFNVQADITDSLTALSAALDNTNSDFQFFSILPNSSLVWV